MTYALVVDWSGPFDSIDACRNAAKEYAVGECLYMAAGMRRYQRTSSLQYVGLSTDPESRFTNQHHKLPEVTRNFKVWIGQVVSHSIAGRRAQHQPSSHSVAVGLAEWMLAYFLQLPLNVQKRANPPPDSAVLLNRWFNPDFATRRKQRVYDDWPDFLEFEIDPHNGEVFAQLNWFATRQRTRLSHAEVLQLAIGRG